MAELTQLEYDAALAKWQPMKIKDLAIEFKRLQDLHAAQKFTAALTMAEFDILRRQVIPKVMEDMGLDTCKVAGVGRVQVGSQLSAKQLDKEGLIEWLKANDHGHLAAETVNSSSLSSFIREQIGLGAPIPSDDVVLISTYDVASVVKV